MSTKLEKGRAHIFCIRIYITYFKDDQVSDARSVENVLLSYMYGGNMETHEIQDYKFRNAPL